MSDSNNDDPLGGLLSSARRRGAQRPDPFADPPSKPDPAGGRGLNPLDLLALPPVQRDLINWLSRRKQACFGDIQQALHVEAAPLEATLADLKASGYIHEALIDGVIYYRVVFRGKITRAGRALPDDIWARVDLDNTIFLQQTPLFNKLSLEEIRDVASHLEARRYHRNEVILWQGGLGEGVYFIKSGIVGITRLSPQSQESQILAYLKQGDLLGEYNLLSEQNVTASATATALSEVDVLLMRRQDFLNMLEHHHSVAVGLARMLVQRLLVTNARVAGSSAEATLSLIFGVGPGAGCTMLGNALAMTLFQTTKSTAVFTEYPDSEPLAACLKMAPGTEVFSHPGGHDILIHRDTSGLPPTVRTTMLMDRLSNQYANVVIGLAAEEGEISDTVIYMLERADQVILIAPPDAETWEKLTALSARLKVAIRPEKTSMFIVSNCVNPDYQSAPARTDFDIPFLGAMPPLPEWNQDSLPEPLGNVAAVLADRLGRTNQIGVYIPTTIEVDRTIDTSNYVNETLAFLGELFGGATSNPAQGVWNSDQVGLVSETIYVVKTYVTKSDLDRYLGDVLEYVERLKIELKQEAMALEVNQKLMLI